MTTANDSFWERNPHAAQESQWTADPFIGPAIYSRISAGESAGHWLEWLTKTRLALPSRARILSIGCGVGDHEVGLAKLLPDSAIEAFDFSRTSIGIAADKAAAEGLTSIRFYQDNFNTAQLPAAAYDLVLCSGSLHHVRELEWLLGQVRTSLRPGGVFIVNEYVGDCYNIYGPEQVAVIQTILDGLPASFKRASHFQNPTMEQVQARDPTEAVRAKLIPDFLRIYFSRIDERRVGGTLLHPLYPFLEMDRIAADPEWHQALMSGLIAIDALLLQTGRSDFSFFICEEPRLSS